MISIILYGRNDSHGYNLHKRAAISLNCIAEILSDPDDEILFVDYNTPNDLPTFIEAVYDTLTPNAKARLRVLRVRPELHARLVQRTHLSALEPHSRNIAIRRSNPRNRWLLFTNTDMIFLPREGVTDLSGAVRDLADGLYIVPRFELPEPLWESLPRTDPKAVMRACEKLGRKLHLEEVTLAFPYMRFDQPGDFQLVPRQALWDIHGFDERMIHGWHADSNMCKRFYLFFGKRTESLAHRIRGYHCDHTRVATLAHRLDLKLDNDLQEFVFGLEDPVAHHQADTWGAPGEPIEELDFANDPPARFVDALERTLRTPQQSEYQADSNDLRNFVAYHEEHVLPYLAGNLTVYPRTARFAYVGNNPRMRSLIARCVAELGFALPLHYLADAFPAGVEPDCAKPIRSTDLPPGASIHDYLLGNYDLLIFDFGLDKAGLNVAAPARVTDWPRDQRYSLGEIAKCLEACAELSDALRSHIPDFLVVNANHHLFRQFVGHFLLLSDTPFATHVRKGRPRVGDERLYRSHTWKYTEDEMRSFFGYGTWENSVPAIAPGDSVDFTSAGQSSRYKDGHWGVMDFTGTWIEGHTAAFLFIPQLPLDDDLIAFVRVNEAFVGPEDEPIRVQVFLEGEPLARWILFTRYEVTVCKVLLPARLMVNKTVCRLEFHVENPQPAQRVAEALGQQTIGDDPRELGIKVQQLAFTNKDSWRYSLGQILDFTEHGKGIDHADECWSPPDNLGSWTIGTEATLTFWPRETTTKQVAATFTINDVAVNEQNPALGVAVAVNGQIVANWILGPTRDTHDRTVILPPEVFRTLEPVKISLLIPSPRTSVAMKWSTWDKRPRGFRLSKLRLAPPLRYRLGDVMDFTESGDAIAFVGDALGIEWAIPDTYGAWTIGNLATIKVPFDEPLPQGVPLAIVISDCMLKGRGARLPVIIKANGHVVEEWTVDDREVHSRTLNLPAEAVASSPELILTFEIREPHSPASLGWGGDTRPLGFRLARAIIGRSEIEIPVFKKPPRPALFTRILGLPGFAIHVARVIVKRFL